MVLNQHLTDYTPEIKEFIKKYNINGYVEKNNEYCFHVLNKEPLSVKDEGIKNFYIGSRIIETGVDSQGKSVKQKYEEYYIVNTKKRVDFLEYFQELKEAGKIDLENHIGSVGYLLESNEPVINNLMSDLHWGDFGATGSGKSVLMLTLLYNMGAFPESEFIILDKDNDFMFLYDAKKVIFHMDFREIVNPVERFFNFLMYLDMYQKVRKQKYERYKCNDWESYNRKRRAEIKETGTTKMELIPYLTILMDEFQTFRTKTSELLGSSDEFDKKIGALLSVCRANGIRLIIGSQDTQKNIIGSGVTNIATRAFYKIDTTSNSSQIPDNYFNLIRSGDFDKSFIFYLSGRGLVKPAFADKEKIGEYITEEMSKLPTGYREKKYSTVMEMLLDVANGVESEILSFYKEGLSEIGFKEDEIKEMEKSESFLTIASLVYEMFSFYDKNILNNPDLNITIPSGSVFPTIIDSTGAEVASIDSNIYSFLTFLNTKTYESVLKNIKNTIIGKIHNDGSDEMYETFTTLFGKVLKDFYLQNIKKVSAKNFIKKKVIAIEPTEDSEGDTESDETVEEQEESEDTENTDKKKRDTEEEDAFDGI